MARNIVVMMVIDPQVILASAVLIIKVFYLVLMRGGRFIGEHEAVFVVIRVHEVVVRMLVDDHLVIPADAVVLVNVSYLLLTKMWGLVIIAQREAAVIMLVVDHFLVVAGSLMLVPLLVLDLVVVDGTRHLQKSQKLKPARGEGRDQNIYGKPRPCSSSTISCLSIFRIAALKAQ
jgi:hypothetical protein